MILCHALPLRPTENVKRSDQKEALYLFCDRGIDDATNQNGMKMKICIGNAYHVDGCSGSSESRPNGLFVIRILGRNLSQRIVPNSFSSVVGERPMAR